MYVVDVIYIFSVVVGLYFLVLMFVFFVKQKTAYEMRISDWSSTCALPIYPHAMSYGYDRLRFIRPVHIGDTITTITTIADKRDHPKRAGHGVVTEKVDIRNQNGETVLACEHLYLVTRRQPIA